MKFRMGQRRLSSILFFLTIFTGILALSVVGEVGNPSPGTTRVGGPPLLAAAKAPAKTSKAFEWKKLGEQVYLKACSSCHQLNGQGVPNTFPPLKADMAVLAKDPRQHILAILKGVQAREVGGVTYRTPMPPFANLSDEEIAAVVNHERTSWGNNAPTVTPADVKKLRGK